MAGAVRGLRALTGAILAAAAFGAAGGAAAQSFPARDLVIVCAFPPGSGSDTLVRFFAEKIRPMVGRTVIVENRFGAGGSIAAEHVARAKPDGHTMLMHAASAIAANMFLYKQPGIDAKKALTVVATVNQQPFMMAVDATRPWKSVQEVTAFLLEKGDKASYATSATAGTIFGEMYKAATGVKAVEVVYRVGAESLNDQLSGRIDYGMFDPVYTMSQVRAGRLRALAVSTPQRMQAVPDIPTMSELGFKDIELKTWFAVMLP
ncbi:MAG TPA: tripartite tricarboxylate transporter substrate binding protein, partial [Beijerinckiaceae bacterium]